MRKHRGDRPVSAVIYTHSHVDHYGGVRGVISDDDIAGYHVRNPLRFAASCPDSHGWRAPAVTAPPLAQVHSRIAEHLRAAARRRAFRLWLDQRRAELVRLAPGYEHPGDPRQPDNTHRH